MPKTTVVY